MPAVNWYSSRMRDEHPVSVLLRYHNDFFGPTLFAVHHRPAPAFGDAPLSLSVDGEG